MVIRWWRRRRDRRNRRRFADEIRNNRTITAEIARIEEPTTYLAAPARWEDST